MPRGGDAATRGREAVNGLPANHTPAAAVTTRPVPQQPETRRVPTKAISFFRGGTNPPICQCSVCALEARTILGIHTGFDIHGTPLEGQDLWNEIAISLPPTLRNSTQLHGLGYAVAAYASEATAEEDWSDQALRYQLFDIAVEPPSHLWLAAPPAQNEP